MYGLGIRLGYYLQWFGAIFAAWMAPSEVKTLRFSIDLFVAASFLALVILTVRDVNSLQPVETYIVLLLMFGAYLALIPIYIWRLLTRCDPYWDPTRWPIVNPGSMSANLSFILLMGVLVYQYWFWFARVPSLDRLSCQQYGFLFGQVRLNSKVSVTINAILYVTLGLICLYLLALKIRHILGFPDPYEGRKKRVISRRHKYAHIQLLRNLDGWFKLIVAICVLAATELTILWNGIEGVNNLSSAGQTIPFVIGLGAVIRILYVYMKPEVEYYSDSDSDYSYRRRSRPRSGGGGGPVPSRQLRTSHVRVPPRRDRPIPTRQIPVPQRPAPAFAPPHPGPPPPPPPPPPAGPYH